MHSFVNCLSQTSPLILQLSVFFSLKHSYFCRQSDLFISEQMRLPSTISSLKLFSLLSQRVCFHYFNVSFFISLRGDTAVPLQGCPLYPRPQSQSSVTFLMGWLVPFFQICAFCHLLLLLLSLGKIFILHLPEMSFVLKMLWNSFSISVISCWQSLLRGLH